MHHRLATTALLLASIAASRTAHAAASLLPGAIQPGAIHIDLSPIASGFVAPTFAAAAPGDSQDLFVVDQPGKISILHNGVVQPTRRR